jgi:hypothetical protein
VPETRVSKVLHDVYLIEIKEEVDEKESGFINYLGYREGANG